MRPALKTAVSVRLSELWNIEVDTTACCAYKGLKGNCEELEMLRAFRDGYLAQQEYDAAIICYLMMVHERKRQAEERRAGI